VAPALPCAARRFTARFNTAAISAKNPAPAPPYNRIITFDRVDTRFNTNWSTTMTNIAIEAENRAVASLLAADRAQDIPQSDDIYGWLAGNWELDVRHYGVDVSALGLKGEAHFFRALEGRAVQDVWIMPARDARHVGLAPENNMYGTTLRTWDASIAAWRVTYINPVTGQRDELIGRRVGSNIIQVGTHRDGTPIRWNFTDVTPDSFHWTGEALEADGATWRLEGEFYAHRIR
jgi:hypothetical protein